MEEDPMAIFRHNVLGELTVIKNALSFVLQGHTGEISQETKKFLEEAYKRNEQAITMAIATRKKPSEEPKQNNG